MLEINLRKFHRYLGAGIAPLVLLQVISGLFLSLDILSSWQEDVGSFLQEVNLPAVAAFWNELFYEIHFGGGALGFLHTLLVALGLIGLTLSGLLIFIKVMARSHLAKATTKQSQKEPQESHDLAGAPPRRGVAVALVVASVGLMALDIFMFATAYRLIGLHAPHLYATQQMQSNISRSRTAVERLLAGDSSTPVASIHYGLSRANTMAKVLLERDEESDYVLTGLQRDILPVEGETQRRRIEEISKALDLLIQKAERDDLAELIAAEDVTDFDSFQRSIALLDSSAEALSEEMMDLLEKDRDHLFWVHLILFSLAFLFMVGVAGLIYFYDMGIQRYLEDIQASREIAHAYQRRFKEVIRQSADPQLVFERDGKIISASLTAVNLLGYSEEELLRQNIANIDSQFDASGYAGGLWDSLAAEAAASIKSLWSHRDGEKIPVVLSVSIVEVGDDGEKPLMLVQARLEKTYV